LHQWELTFEEDFENSKLNEDIWLTSYYWGKMLLKEGYSLAGDEHLLTEGKNLEVGNSNLSIVTRKENANGKIWNPEMGFMPQEFEYTSGIINTANSFRQKFGLFEAKVKLNNPSSVQHAFWMVGEKMLPHIDIFRFNSKGKKAVMMNNFWASDSSKTGFDKNQAKVSISSLQNEYFIYALEWESGKLTWKINDMVLAEQTTGVPDEELFLQFSSGINSAKGSNGLPATMDIDWVRCYKKAGE
jgi:beta-glucanase (GH16 family)